MLYATTTKAIRVPFTRMVLLRSPCAVPDVFASDVSVMNDDGTWAYRVRAQTSCDVLDGAARFTSVVRLKDVLVEWWKHTTKGSDPCQSS